MSTGNPTIKHLMWLARIELSEEEQARMQKEIENIIHNFINKLLEAKLEEVEPLYHPLEKQGILRPDTPKPSLSQEEALANASKTENGYIIAPRPLED